MKGLQQLTVAGILLSVVTCLASCVDKDYRIDADEIDTGIHVSPGGVTVPLAIFGTKTLAEMVSDDLDELVLTDDGYYALRYEDRFEYEVDPIDIPSVGAIGGMFGDISIPVDIPSFDFSGDTDIQGLYLSRTGALPVSGNVPATTASGTIQSYEGKIEMDFGLPDEIASVGTVWLGPDASGTPVSLIFDIGALRNVNAGILMETLTVDLPARYRLSRPSYGSIGPGIDGGTANRLTITGYNMGTSPRVVLKFYIESFTLGDKIPVPASGPGSPAQTISFTEDFGYELKYTMTTRAGYVDPAGDKPSLVIDGSPRFKDATLTTKAISIAGSDTEALDYRIGMIPWTVRKLVSIDFEDTENILVITLDDPGLPFRNSEPRVRVSFPPLLLLNDPNVSDGVLTAPLSAFTSGYRLRIDGIELGADGAVDDNWYIDLGDLGYGIGVDIEHTFLPETLTWSSDIAGLLPASSLGVAMDASGLSVGTIHAELDLSFDEYISGQIHAIDLTDITDELGDGEFTPDLTPPTFTMSVTNPVGISIESTLRLDPMRRDGTSLGDVEVENIFIEPSDEDGSETTYIFIAEEGVSTPVDHTYTRYNADLRNLVEIIPSTIDIKLGARAKTNTVHTVPIGEYLPFGISYTVDIPLEFGEDMDLKIEVKEDGMNGTFTDLAEAKVKAADISVGVELEVSFPFLIDGVTAEFTDADGNSIPGLETKVLGAIEGPPPGSGSARTSLFTIGISVPNGGDFETLSSIDALKLTLPVTGTGSLNRVRPGDYISGRAWITLAKGVNVDIGKL